MNHHRRMELVYDVDYGSLVDGWFIELVQQRGLRHVLGSRWTTGADPETLADAARARVSYAHDRSEELIVDVDDAVAHVIFRERTVTVRTAAATRAAVETAQRRLRHRLPPSDAEGLQVDARFWWWQAGFADDVARAMRVPSWPEIADNYAAITAARLGQLATWTSGPPSSGRLIVAHGASGTGKTHAVRMLAGAWRSWAEFHFVTDPEQFLAQPGYLMEVGRDDPMDARARWRVAVLEDAGEQLARDAAHAGRSLSRVLNVCDGVLGQAVRMLVLVTTNEAPAVLHPALLRPGRQLADIPFAKLSGDEIVRWCARRDAPLLDQASATLAELYAHAEGRALGCGAAAPFGFAAATRGD